MFCVSRETLSSKQKLGAQTSKMFHVKHWHLRCSCMRVQDHCRPKNSDAGNHSGKIAFTPESRSLRQEDGEVFPPMFVAPGVTAAPRVFPPHKSCAAVAYE